MKKVLITGFDAFGGETINPSWESVKRLPEKIGDFAIAKLQIPTAFKKGSQKVLDVAKTICPDVILCIGQAGGRQFITPEVVAINLMDAKIADNLGYKPINEQILNGQNAYFSTVPVREIVENLNAKGIPSALSYSAGTFVCNEVLYTLLHHYENTSVRVGFIHVPYLTEQAKNGEPSMPIENIVNALKIAIETL